MFSFGQCGCLTNTQWRNGPQLCCKKRKKLVSPELSFEPQLSLSEKKSEVGEIQNALISPTFNITYFHFLCFYSIPLG